MNKTIITFLLLMSPFIVHSQWSQVNGPKDFFSGPDVIVNDSLLILSTSGASFYSIDGGDHWRPFMPEVFYHSVVFQDNLYTGGQYYSGSISGRLRKHAFGNGSWEHQVVYTNNGPVNGMAADQEHVYAVFENNTLSDAVAGFTFSADGVTWIQQNNGLPKDSTYFWDHWFFYYNLFSIGVNDQFVFVGAKDGVYRSEKTGFQWSRFSQGLPEYGSVNAIACHDSLLVIAIGNKLYRSLNNGQNWAFNYELAVNNTVHRLRCIGGTFFVLTELQGLLVSHDWGETWSPANNGLDNLQSLGLANMDSTFYLSHRTGISKGFNAWESINNDIVVSNVRDMAQTATAMAAVEFNKVFISQDEGLTWEDRTPVEGLDGYIYSIVNVNGCLLFSFKREWLEESLNYRSCDHGNTWVPVASLFSDGNVYKLRSNGTRVVAFVNSSIFLSENTGDSWNDITPTGSLQGSLSDVLFTGDDIYAAYNYDDKVIHSGDFGQTWHLCNEGLDGEEIETLGVAQGMIFAVGINRTFRSSNQGISWVECAPLGDDVQEIISDSNLVFACKFRQVYFSRNSGDSWIDISDGLPLLPDLWGGTLMVRGDQLLFGTTIYGIQERNILDLPTGVKERPPSRKFGLFPNPVIDYLSVHSYDRQVIATVEILDLSARMIRHPEITGNRIDLRDLAPAVYILRIITADKMVYYQKFVKNR